MRQHRGELPCCSRRALGTRMAALCLSGTAWANTSAGGLPAEAVPLDAGQSRAFRDWFVAIAQDQASRGPSPRWVHRDCAGLVRFAAAQAMVPHNRAWLASMGWPSHRPRPADDLSLSEGQLAWRNAWRLPNGERAAYASAIAIVQNNTRLLGKHKSAIAPGDLLFFDQGDDQHLMVWTGRSVVYHTGAEPSREDNGLRRASLANLERHSDTRWRPVPENPNFGGWFRFRFLT
ncbi:MAG: DUF1175 family protein, partial [Pseudomonadota bacterium]